MHAAAVTELIATGAAANIAAHGSREGRVHRRIAAATHRLLMLMLRMRSVRLLLAAPVQLLMVGMEAVWQ